ncbi:MAG: ATP-binding cassette domain-containing protein [Caldilinea sp.]|nr:ATP-binding cassette domain-containing protein [Caldilinea sp.]
MKNIAIEFPGVKALQGVDFTVHTGRIQALIGANGAGKSTLMKILAGAYSHYTGSIRMDGQEVDIHTPRASKAQGNTGTLSSDQGVGGQPWGRDCVHFAPVARDL